MKCFKHTLAYDLKHGIWEKKGGYFVTALLAVFLFTDYSIKLRNYYGNGIAGNPDVTMADYLLYFFSGRYPYMEGEQVFLIPITWLLIFLYSSLLVLNYPMQNLCGHGIQVLIRIRDRKLWWLSKCGYVLCSTVLYYFILYAVTFVLCLISGVRLSAGYSESAMENILNFTFQTLPEKTGLLVQLFFMPVLVSLAVNLLQLGLSLLLDRIYAFMLVAVLLLLSTYIQAFWLPGVYAMVMRSSWVMDGGVLWKQGILVTGIYMIVSATAGMVRIRRFDILKKEAE